VNSWQLSQIIPDVKQRPKTSVVVFSFSFYIERHTPHGSGHKQMQCVLTTLVLHVEQHRLHPSIECICNMVIANASLEALRVDDRIG
jgi:hypothetical protein